MILLLFKVATSLYNYPVQCENFIVAVCIVKEDWHASAHNCVCIITETPALQSIQTYSTAVSRGMVQQYNGLIVIEKL